MPTTIMTAGEVISSYHSLWQLEASFRLSEGDLRSQPVFQRDLRSRNSKFGGISRLNHLRRFALACVFPDPWPVPSCWGDRSS